MYSSLQAVVYAFSTCSPPNPAYLFAAEHGTEHIGLHNFHQIKMVGISKQVKFVRIAPSVVHPVLFSCVNGVDALW